MGKVALKYRKPLSGKYNKLVYECPQCNHSLIEGEGNLFNEIIGFNEATIGPVAMVECPKCKTHWFYHSRSEEKYGVYEYFLDCITFGTQKHFKDE